MEEYKKQLENFRNIINKKLNEFVGMYQNSEENLPVKYNISLIFLSKDQKYTIQTGDIFTSKKTGLFYVIQITDKFVNNHTLQEYLGTLIYDISGNKVQTFLSNNYTTDKLPIENTHPEIKKLISRLTNNKENKLTTTIVKRYVKSFISILVKMKKLKDLEVTKKEKQIMETIEKFDDSHEIDIKSDKQKLIDDIKDFINKEVKIGELFIVKYKPSNNSINIIGHDISMGMTTSISLLLNTILNTNSTELTNIISCDDVVIHYFKKK